MQLEVEEDGGALERMRGRGGISREGGADSLPPRSEGLFGWCLDFMSRKKWCLEVA